MPPLKSHWGLWLVLVVVALQQPNAVTQDNEQVADDNKHGALVAVETEDEDEPVPASQKVFGRDVYDPDMEIFQATHQWQTVKQGQAIPPGLHVRLNLETGQREAKLLDDTSAKEPPETTRAAYVTQGSPDRVQRMKDAIQQAMQQLDSGDTSTDDTKKESDLRTDDKEERKNAKEKYFTRDELKDALKKFKAEKNSGDEMVKTKHRSIDELKKEFAEMNAVFKSDLEILEELLEKYKQPDLSEDHLRTILADLEYYLHQIDNAQNFVTLGGLECVMRDLNHTAGVIRSETALVLGSAVQGNPQVQVAAVEVGAMQQLVRMLSLEPSVSVRSHVLYALSALVRHFPHAQQRFLEQGGLHALRALFSQPDTTSLRLRAVTLINDMLVEQKATLQHKVSTDATQQEKIRQYQKVRLLEAVRDQDWCHLVSSLLSLPEHDAREKVLHAMSTLSTHCQASFTGTRTLLMSLRTEYKKLAVTEAEEDDDTYFRDMVALVDIVMKDLIVVKTEL